MRGCFSQIPKLAGRIDKPATKVVLPHSIYDHARREGGCIFDDGIGQLETTAASAEAARLTAFRREGGKETSGHRITCVVWISPILEFEIPGKTHFIIQLCPLFVVRIDDVKGGIDHSIGHRHVVVSGRGLDPFDFGLGGLELVAHIGWLFLFKVCYLLFKAGDFSPCFFDGSPEGIVHCRQFGLLHRGEDTRQCIVVFSGDGIGFVVVAAGTSDGEAEKGASDGIDVLFPLIGHCRSDNFGRELELFEIGGTQANEAHGHTILR